MKFYGKIGYSEPVEQVAGVVEDVVTEHNAFGDILRPSMAQREANQVNDNLTTGNSFSILMDAWANEANIAKMRYIVWQGVRWKVSDVEVQRPRLIIRPGGVYNGPRAATPPGA